MKDGLSIAQFYKDFKAELQKLGLTTKFIETPFDMGIDKPFDALEEYGTYSWEDIHKFWQLMQWNNSIFKEFSGRFYGKTCPVHIYWHHMDLAVTRVSGKKLPPMDKSAHVSERDTYSHEQISFGFWIGDDNVQQPAYYSYTYPAPDGMDKKALKPDAAQWVDANGSPMASLFYEDIRSSEDPRQDVLDFLESAYQAGAMLAGWDIDELRAPSLKDI